MDSEIADGSSDTLVGSDTRSFSPTPSTLSTLSTLSSISDSDSIGGDPDSDSDSSSEEGATVPLGEDGDIDLDGVAIFVLPWAAGEDDTEYLWQSLRTLERVANAHAPHSHMQRDGNGRIVEIHVRYSDEETVDILPLIHQYLHWSQTQPNTLPFRDQETVLRVLAYLTNLLNVLIPLVGNKLDHDILSAFMERFIRPRIDEILDDLPVVEIDWENQVESSSCSVCLEEYDPTSITIVLRCHPSHHFHRCCISTWLETRDHCPICRAPVINRLPTQN